MSRAAKPRPIFRNDVFAVSLVLFTALVAVSGYAFYASRKRSLDAEVHNHLQEIVDLKASELAAWREERIGDATVLRTEMSVMHALQEGLAHGFDADLQRRMRLWTDAIRSSYHYAAVVLMDREGNIRMLSGELFGSRELYQEMGRDAMRSDEIFLRGVPMDGRVSRPQFVAGSGVRDQSGKTIGAILLEIDPATHLYPVILRWPAATRTGQVVLLRREGDEVAFLSDVNGYPGSALKMRRKLTDLSAVSVRAALGERDLDGWTTKGVKILGSAKPVAGSDWLLSAGIVAEEAYEPLKPIRRGLWLIGGLLIATFASGMALLRRRELSSFYRQQYEAEIERRALLGHYDYMTRFANDAVFLLDENAVVVEVNERAIDWFGYTREELVGMEVRNLRPKELQSSFPEIWETVQREKQALFETVNQRKDGTTFPTEISVRLIEVEGRKYAQSIIRDITERKQAEEQIRRLNRLYLLLSRLGLAIIHSHTDADLFAAVCAIAVNQGGFRLAAIGMVEPETKRIRQVACAGEADGYLQEAPMTAADDAYGNGPAGRSIREGRTVVCDDIPCDPAMAAWRDSAARFGLRSSISLPLRRGGRIIGHLGLYSAEIRFFNEQEVALAEEMAASVSYALDVLEQDRQRRQAEGELRISEERLELILDATNEGYWDRDLVTGIGHQNPRYEEMLGYQPGELPADFESWRALVHPEDVSTMLAALSAVKQPGQGVSSADLRMRCKNGQYIWVLWRGKVVARDAQGVPTRIVGTNTDITERRQLQEQFLQAQKLESVGRLAGGVAHDFNNLLTVINGYSDLALQRLDEGHPLRRLVDQIRKAGATAARLTEQLLAFSRRQVIEPRIIDLNAVIAATAPMLGPLLGASIELVVDPDPLPAAVMADSSQMKQVIMNLAVNARDAMPSGGVFRITTRHAEVDSSHSARNGDAVPGSYVVLEASDTGTGMDESTQRLIFEPFFTTKPEGQGTGLGLATVYGIVKQGHGWIEVDSKVDCGSTFTIYLPQAVGSVSPTAPEQTAPVDSAGSETVLVVEDQDNVRKLVTEVVAARNYHVLEASSGDEALTLAQHYNGPIHILITDVVMPRMSGRELAEKLTSRRPDTRVLFMTAHADEILRRKRPAGRIDLIVKPFAPDALVQKIREVLDRSDTRSPVS